MTLNQTCSECKQTANVDSSAKNWACANCQRINKTIVPKYIDTTWETAHYDVWGNDKDGYEINDVYRQSSEVEIRIAIKVNNAGTPQEFLSAYPSNSQIRKALGLRRFKIDTDGDDLVIYVNRSRDSYPCGEIRCTSHESLSPIRPLKAS